MIGLIGFISGMQGGLTFKTKHTINVNYHVNRLEEEKLWSSGKRKNKHLNSAPIHDKSSLLLLFSCSDSLWPHGLQHTRLPYPSPFPGACSYLDPLSQWCHWTISSSVVPFSSCLQSFPASGSFAVNQLFASGYQSTEASTSASVLLMNIQDWFPLGLTGLISLQSKESLYRVFNTTIQKHQFFGIQPSLWSNSSSHPYMTTGKTIHYTDLCWQSNISAFWYAI